MDDETLRRYTAAGHAIQTGIEFDPDKRNLEPKHLRVGITLTKTDMAGLVRLLIGKGVITDAEYCEAVAAAAEREAAAEKERLSKILGANVTLL